MPLPNAVTEQRGTRDTADRISQEAPLDISSNIWKFNPNKCQALGWALRNAGKPEAKTQRTFGHLEKAPFGNWVEFTGVAEVAQGVTGLVFKAGAGQRLTIGSRVFFPDINEIIRVNAEFASSTTSAGVMRNFGRGTAACLLKPGMKGLAIPPSFYEAFETGKGHSLTKVYKSFNLEEVSYPVQASNIAQNSKHLGGSPFESDLRDTIDEAKEKMEGGLLYSGQLLDTSTFAHPIGASEGIDNYIQTNVWSATKLSRMDFFDIIAEWESFNKDGGAILCSNLFKQMVTQWAIQISSISIPITGQSGEGVLGASIDKVRWGTKTYDLVEVDLLGQEWNLAGRVYLVPNGKIKYCYLSGPEGAMDIGYTPFNRKWVHAKEGELYGCVGWEFFLEETWGKIVGLQF